MAIPFCRTEPFFRRPDNWSGRRRRFLAARFRSSVNPSNQFTGTFTVDKIFNRAAISLSGSVNRTEYENQTVQPNFSSRTFTENAAVWFGPLIYAYSNGYLSTVITDATLGTAGLTPSTSTTSYRVIGGLGTRPGELFRGLAYFGHQGSDSGSASSGAYPLEVTSTGARFTTIPSPSWTFSRTIDRTINISSQPSAASNLALALPGVTGVQIPLSASTIITSTGLQSSYQITPQWFANGLLSFTRIEYVGSPRLDTTLIFDATLRYDIWRNMSLELGVSLHEHFIQCASRQHDRELRGNGRTYRF